MTDSIKPPSSPRQRRQKAYDKLIALRKQSTETSVQPIEIIRLKRSAMRALKSLRDDQDRELFETTTATDWVS